MIRFFIASPSRQSLFSLRLSLIRVLYHVFPQKQSMDFIIDKPFISWDNNAEFVTLGKGALP